MCLVWPRVKDKRTPGTLTHQRHLNLISLNPIYLIPLYLYPYIPISLYTFIPIHLYTYIPLYLYTSIPHTSSPPMKRKILLSSTLTLLFLSSVTFAQDFGLAFSYFLPKNGYFSTPISPFSIRGVGFDLTPFLAIETGASLYRMSGLNIKDLPFESKSALVGPNFTVFIPAELVIQLKGSMVEFDIKGGGFFFYGFDQRINYGNMDK